MGRKAKKKYRRSHQSSQRIVQSANIVTTSRRHVNIDRVKSASSDYVLTMDQVPIIPSRITRTAVSRLEVIHHFQYSESTWVTPQIDREMELPPQAFDRDLQRLVSVRLCQSPSDDFIVAKIDDRVGCGLFANRKFRAGEVVLTYAGLHQLGAISTGDDYPLGGTADSHISAKDIGGLARFIQHMPNNQDDALQRLNRYHQHPEQMPAMFKYTADGYFLTDAQNSFPATSAISYEQYAQYMFRQNADFRLNSSEYFSFSSRVQQHQHVAWANLTFISVPVNGIPVYCFIALRDIEQYEQLGFEYGYGYWAGRKMTPCLFDKSGRLLTHEVLTHQKKFAFVEVKTATDQSIHCYYSMDKFKQHNLKQLPVALNPQAKLISLFALRKQLVKLRILPLDYAPIVSENSITQILRMQLGDLIKSAELYYFDPLDKQSDQSYRVDLILTTSTLIQWAQLYALFEPLCKICKRFRLTQEIVIRGVNMHLREMESILQNLPMKLAYVKRHYQRPEACSCDAMCYQQGSYTMLDFMNVYHPDPARNPVVFYRF